jgi:transposase-like protein
MTVGFKDAHFMKDIILTGVRWYGAYPLSDRQVEGLMQARGVPVDYATITRGVLKYAPPLEKAFHCRKRPSWGSWRMDRPTAR